MSYLIPVLLFLVLVAITIAIIRIVSARTAGPDGSKDAPFAEDDNSPLWATDEASDAGIDPAARERDEREAA